MNDAMKALERLYQKANPTGGDDECRDDYVAIRAALEAKAEPVAFLVERGEGDEKHSHLTWADDETAWAAEKTGSKVTPLYAAPPSTAEVRAQVLDEVMRALTEDYWPSEAGEGVAQVIELIAEMKSSA